MDNICNVYCDESCHLESDKIHSMALGAIWCDKHDLTSISNKIKDIKAKHGLPLTFEIKWTKVSPAKINFYAELINYFFDEKKLHFRALIIPDKQKLNHAQFNQTHDEWYYKMYFQLLREILDPKKQFNIYIDIKDTRGYEKVQKLHDVLCNDAYDFDKSIIHRIQQIRSNEVSIIQLTDLLTGALTYLHRNLSSSKTKKSLVEIIKRRSGHNLIKSTLPKEAKFNLFVWSPR